MTTKSTDTREQLLTAALSILMDGEGVLTLDAVAKRSGISKGGLIHHFPTREALVEGVVEAIIQRFTAAAAPVEPPAEASLAEIKAYVDASLEPGLREATAQMARGLIRLFGSDFRKHTPFLDPWRNLFAQRLDRYRQEGDLDGFAKAAVVTLAIESFVMIDVFELYRFSSEEITAIRQELTARF